MELEVAKVKPKTLFDNTLFLPRKGQFNKINQHPGIKMEAAEKSHMVVDVVNRAVLEESSQLHQSDEGEKCGRNSSSESCSNSEIVKAKGCCCSSCTSSLSEVDLESGAVDDTKKVHLEGVERDCRICHLSLDAGNPESGLPIELGCSCKDDLAAAHRHCAEAWFKIRGNKTCEICGSVAQNVAVAIETELAEQWNGVNYTAVAIAAAPVIPAETRSFWRGHRFLNFLLACMVFAFVISWLFHFNVPS